MNHTIIIKHVQHLNDIELELPIIPGIGETIEFITPHAHGKVLVQDITHVVDHDVTGIVLKVTGTMEQR